MSSSTAFCTMETTALNSSASKMRNRKRAKVRNDRVEPTMTRFPAVLSILLLAMFCRNAHADNFVKTGDLLSHCSVDRGQPDDFCSGTWNQLLISYKFISFG